MTTVGSLAMLAGRVLTSVLMFVLNNFQKTSCSASPLFPAQSKN